MPLAWSFSPFPKRHDDRNSVTRDRILVMRKELLDNIQCIDNYRVILSSGNDWPICRTNHTALDNFLRENFVQISVNFYGEDASIISEWQEIKRDLDTLNRSARVANLKENLKISKNSLKD